MIQLSQAEYETLVSDAMRYRGLRLIATEPDEALHERMIDALNDVLPDPSRDDVVTPEQFDSLVDRGLIACDAVRRCN